MENHEEMPSHRSEGLGLIYVIFSFVRRGAVLLRFGIYKETLL